MGDEMHDLLGRIGLRRVGHGLGGSDSTHPSSASGNNALGDGGSTTDVTASLATGLPLTLPGAAVFAGAVCAAAKAALPAIAAEQTRIGIQRMNVLRLQDTPT